MQSPLPVALLGLLAVLGVPGGAAAQDCAGRATPSQVLTIENEAGVPASAEERLTLDTCRTVSFFETEVALPLKRPLSLRIADHGCLRTGYEFESGTVVFCRKDQGSRPVLDHGLRSIDVIRHELFHALFCQYRPDVCQGSRLQDVDTVALLEGTADYFAYRQRPGDHFGEDFFTDGSYLRDYRSSLCHSLVPGAHPKGEAVAAFLIRERYALRLLAPWLESARPISLEGLGADPSREPCFSHDGAPELRVEVEGAPPSPLDRYWTEPELSLVFHLKANAALAARYPKFSFRWTARNGGRFAVAPVEGDGSSFELKPLVARGHDELRLDLVSDGEVVGFRLFHLGIRSR